MADQTKHYKQNWDTTVIQEGGLKARLKAFEDLKKKNQKDQEIAKGAADPEVLRKIADAQKNAKAQREAAMSPKRSPKKDWKFRSPKKPTEEQAEKLKESMVVEESADDKGASQETKEAQETKENNAATKMQALVRSSLARIQTGKMLDGMIEDLMKEQDEIQEKIELKEKRADEMRKSQPLEVALEDLTADGWGWGFTGPLQLPMSRVPNWFMEEVEHSLLHPDDLAEAEEAYFQSSDFNKLGELEPVSG